MLPNNYLYPCCRVYKSNEETSISLKSDAVLQRYRSFKIYFSGNFDMDNYGLGMDNSFTMKLN